MSDLPHGRLLELELLRTFETVVELGGFTAAAERLHRTQSTISMQMRRLEEMAGCRVMTRNNQGIALTPEGATLLGHARRMLRLNAEALAALGAHGLEGRVRLGVPADYTASFLSGVLPAFGQAYPSIELEVICDLSESLRALLAEGELDLAIGTFDGAVPGGEVVRAEPLVWAGAKEGSAWSRDPLPLAVFPPRCQFRELALSRLMEAGRSAKIAYTSPSMAGIEVAVASDFAVAPITRGSVRETMQELGDPHGLPSLPLVETTLLQGAGLSAPAERLADFIRENAATG